MTPTRGKPTRGNPARPDPTRADPTRRTTGGGSRAAQPPALVPFRLEPGLRRAIEMRLIERVHDAWGLGEIGGFRLAAWVRHDNRELILRRRVEALSDAEIVELWDGELPEAQRAKEPAAEVHAEIYSRQRIRLHVPGYLVGHR